MWTKKVVVEEEGHNWVASGMDLNTFYASETEIIFLVVNSKQKCFAKTSWGWSRQN